MTWLAVYSRPNAERSVANRIREHAPVFYPFIREVKRVRRFRRTNLVTVETALFTQYLFVQVEPYWVWYLKTVPDLLAVVSIRGEPLVIPDKVVDAVRSLADADGCVQDNDFTKRQFKVGQMVRIDWPGKIFDGFVAQLATVRKNEVSVFLRMLGSEREIRVPAQRVVAAAVVG